MKAVRRAVIDVGTNSVKLLVADVENHAVQPVWEEGEQTRLGEGFYRTHLLQAKAIARTVRAVKELAAVARTRGAGSARVIATSAARDALNQHELIAAIERDTGLTAEVITGEQEAEWVYLGVATGGAFGGQRVLIMDAGGGSTEFILGEGDRRLFQHSFPMGAVRLLEKLHPQDPPRASELQECREGLNDFLAAEVKPLLEPELAADRGRTWLVGTGGTAVILARMVLSLDAYDRELIEAARLSSAALSQWVEHLWSLTIEERRKIPGLPAPRADVILTGAAIYEAAMTQFGFSELRATTRGLRFAALLDLPRHATALLTTNQGAEGPAARTPSATLEP